MPSRISFHELFFGKKRSKQEDKKKKTDERWMKKKNKKQERLLNRSAMLYTQSRDNHALMRMTGGTWTCRNSAACARSLVRIEFEVSSWTPRISSEKKKIKRNNLH